MRHWALVPFAILLASCGPDSGPHDVLTPCGTFLVTDDGVPLPLQQVDDYWELDVALTPEENPEARRIYNAISRGPITLRVHPTMENVQALRLVNGHVFLRVSTREEGLRIAKLFCYRE
jgi:hypothetical protein